MISNKNLKILKIVTIAIIIPWILFIIGDYFQEIARNDTIFSTVFLYISYIAIFCIPIIYLKNEKNLTNKLDITKLKLFIISSIIWIIEALIIGLSICIPVNYGKWIIKQHFLGYFSLNGLEYFPFAFAIGILPILIVMVAKIIIFLFKKLKKIISR